MRWPFRFLLLSGLLPLLPAQNSDTEQFFESKIRPILANNCYACHTGAKSGGLRLDSREGILQGGGLFGPAGADLLRDVVDCIAGTPEGDDAAARFMAMGGATAKLSVAVAIEMAVKVAASDATSSPDRAP